MRLVYVQRARLSSVVHVIHNRLSTCHDHDRNRPVIHQSDTVSRELDRTVLYWIGCAEYVCGDDFVELEPETVTELRRDAAEAERLIDLPASELIRRVADPAVSAGGGVIAGLTLAGAASAAELVIRLAARRKALASRKAEIERLLGLVSRHRELFEHAADRDMQAFAALVDVQRRAKQVRETDPLQSQAMLDDAYVQAAEVPLELSREGLAFLTEVEQALEFATKFTISDLGAAAVLARGGIEAALLTVEANLAYVTDQRAGSLRADMLRLRGTARELGERILTLTTDKITKQGNGD